MAAVGPGASVSSTACFASSDSEHGTEVWRYTGGSSATLFRDVRPGPESGNPSQFTAVDPYVVFVANDGVHGPELYTTAAINPTGMLGDVQPGAAHPAPTILGASNGWLWFTTPATSTSNRPATDLWVTNGTSAPIKKGEFAEGSVSQVTVLSTRSTLLFLARPLGAPSGYIDFFRVNANGSPAMIERLRINGAVPVPTAPIYAATTNFVCFQFIDKNEEPMVCNLNTGVTGLLMDIVPGTAGSLPTNFVSNGTDRVCFAATSTEGGCEVWTTLGSAATTSQLADVASGAGSSNPTHLVMSRGNAGVFFQVENGANRDLYFADPTAAPGSFRLCDSAVQDTTQHTAVSSTELAYVKPEASQFRVRLADGKTAPPINIGPSFFSLGRLWNSSTSTPMGSSLYLVGTSTSHGPDLLRRSGSSLFNVSMPAAPSGSAGPRNFFAYGSAEQLFVSDTSSTGNRLFRLDSGSANEVTLQKPSDMFSSNASSLPAEFTEVAGSLFFTADDGNDRRLFHSATGQQGSAHAVPLIYDPEQLVRFQGRLFLLARGVPDGTDAKKVFQVEIVEGSLVVSLFDGGHSATALKAAANKLFFVEPDTAASEFLQGIKADLTLELPPPKFFKDSLGAGITQLTAGSAHLYFSAVEDSSPTGKRLLWGTDGTAAGLVDPSTLIVNPQLLGALGDACVFWSDAGNNSDYLAWSWDGDSGQPPTMFFDGPIYDTPEPHRVNGQPAGVVSDGGFFFTTQSGRLWRTDGISIALIFYNGGLKVRPESLASLSGRLLFMATETDLDNLLFSYSSIEGERLLDSNSSGSMPCPLVVVGGKAYFTVGHLDSNIGATDLWRTDGTVEGTQMVRDTLIWRELSNVPMGSYRGHLVLGAARQSGVADLEPVLLNYEPVIPVPASFAGALRNQPFTFTYQDMVVCPVTDDDGDAFTMPLRALTFSGSLTRNGLTIGVTSTEIAPGDVFTWTPDPNASGLQTALLLLTADEFQETQAAVLVEVDTPHDLWCRAHFTTEELADSSISFPPADPNSNGISNAFEFVFGRDPKVADATPGWTSLIAMPAGGGAPVMRFSFTRLATLPEGTVLTVTCSPDLSAFSWSPIATKTENAPWDSPAAVVTESTLPDGRIQVQVDMPLTPGGQFLRLEASF